VLQRLQKVSGSDSSNSVAAKHRAPAWCPLLSRYLSAFADTFS